MTADSKFNLLTTIQTQFNKLQNDIGLPSTGNITPGSSEPVVKQENNDTALNKTSAPTYNEVSTDQE